MMTIDQRLSAFSGRSFADFGVDSRAAIPDICREARRAVIDIIRGDEPTTVLGYLIANRDRQLGLNEIAKALGKPVDEVDWTTEMLEQDELCVRFADGKSTQVMALAPYSPRNTRPDLHKCHP
jgi:hypothetical protein